MFSRDGVLGRKPHCDFIFKSTGCERIQVQIKIDDEGVKRKKRKTEKIENFTSICK